MQNIPWDGTIATLEWSWRAQTLTRATKVNARTVSNAPPCQPFSARVHSKARRECVSMLVGFGYYTTHLCVFDTASNGGNAKP